MEFIHDNRVFGADTGPVDVGVMLEARAAAAQGVPQ